MQEGAEPPLDLIAMPFLLFLLRLIGTWQDEYFVKDPLIRHLVRLSFSLDVFLDKF